MKLCRTEFGHAARIVCPYHQWSYALNGELVACGGMDKDGDLDRRDYGLHRAHVREVGGLTKPEPTVAAERPPTD
jgi:Rieske 2Fe-2S family protein